ncbi:MAG: AI-2E family transporter [Saprospiraceae bacterium]|nr:AI-2E family transporter [Saprospiraceae bacterium]
MKLHPIQKLFFSLGTLILAVVVMWYGAFLLIPICYAIILGIVINPVLTYLQSKLKSHFLAYLISIIGVLLLIFIPFGVVTDQLQSLFSELEMDSIGIEKVTSSIQQTLIETRLSTVIDLDMLKSQMDKVLGFLGTFVQSILSGSGHMLVNFALAIVFSYFFSAYYRDTKKIILAELQSEERKKWRKIARQAPNIIRSYLSGMLIVMAILAVLNSLALLIIGIKYAFVWGLIIGMLAIIPYAGTFIGLMLPLSYSFISSNDYKQPLAIIICYIVIQQIEGNFLTPKIVGDKLNVNPFIIIVMILLFGKIWGIDGVIISLPLIGVVKAILQEYPGGQLLAEIISSKEAQNQEKSNS